LKTCVKLLMSQYLNSISYQELESFVKIEELQQKLTEQINTVQNENFRQIVIEFYCQISIQFWLENSCFENNFLLNNSEVISTFVDKIDLMIQISQNESEDIKK
jgi:hypothetical protein